MAMTRLNCKVPEQLEKVIGSLMAQNGGKKGKALKTLLDLAIENPSHPLEDFGDDESTSCTLNLSEKDYEATLEYRKEHGLGKKRAFFLDALKRGASVTKRES